MTEKNKELGREELLLWLRSAEKERLVYMPKYTREQEKQAYEQIKSLIQHLGMREMAVKPRRNPKLNRKGRKFAKHLAKFMRILNY